MTISVVRLEPDVGRPAALPEPSLSTLAQRVFAEFREMPCLRLAPAQARRLFGLEESECQRVLAELVDAGRLQRRPDGRYARTTARE